MKQLGRNDKYPKEIETWKLDDPDIPSWLSDRCNIKGLDENGDPIIDIRENGEGYEIITAGTNQVLVRTNGKSDIICFGNNKVFALTEKQLNLLYGY